MAGSNEQRIDPDPFLIAALCLQSAAVILQLVQISQSKHIVKSSSAAISNRTNQLEHLESALEDFDKAIDKAERTVRRQSDAPDRELYQSSFRVSLGVLNFSAKGVEEYHNTLADATGKLAAVTRWIGHIIHHDPEIAAELGSDILMTVTNSSERLNRLIEDGGTIEAVLREAKLVREVCRNKLASRLDHRTN